MMSPHVTTVQANVCYTSFQDTQARPVTIYSIGHSNQKIEEFLELLNKHSVQTLIDVRSQPYSRYVPNFLGPELARAVGQVDIQYRFMGKELGGRPDGDEFYDANDYVLYYRVAKSPFFLDGIKRLAAEGRASRVAIMCSEEDPTTCHRHILIGRVLTQLGINLLHIRGNGYIQTEFEQLSLLDEQEPDGKDREDRAWKSIQPVLRRKPQPNSSDH